MAEINKGSKKVHCTMLKHFYKARAKVINLLDNCFYKATHGEIPYRLWLNLSDKINLKKQKCKKVTQEQ